MNKKVKDIKIIDNIHEDEEDIIQEVNSTGDLAYEMYPTFQQVLVLLIVTVISFFFLQYQKINLKYMFLIPAVLLLIHNILATIRIDMIKKHVYLFTKVGISRFDIEQRKVVESIRYNEIKKINISKTRKDKLYHISDITLISKDKEFVLYRIKDPRKLIGHIKDYLQKIF